MRPRVHATAVLFVVLAAAACLVAGAAELDHSRKNHRMRAADVPTWYCVNRGVECDEPQTDDIEAAWQRRELLYRGAVGGLAYAALASGAVLAGRRRLAAT